MAGWDGRKRGDKCPRRLGDDEEDARLSEPVSTLAQPHHSVHRGARSLLPAAGGGRLTFWDERWAIVFLPQSWWWW